MPAGGLAASGVAGALGLGTTIYGILQKKKYEREAAANKMPAYNIPGEDQNALQLAESQAGQGMSDASRQAYLNNADAGLAATTNAILRGGGDANSIGNAYNRYETGINNQAIYDDQARMKHLQDLTEAWHRMSAQKDKQWQINQYAPWANKAQAIAQQLAGSQNMITSGINTLGGAATTAANGYFGRIKPLAPTGGRTNETIGQLPVNPGGQNPSWQPPSYGMPSMPNMGGGWYPPMAAQDQQQGFQFPNYYNFGSGG